MDPKQQQGMDVRLVHGEALQMAQKAFTIAADAFKSVYDEAVRLTKELEITKAALAEQQKIEAK